MASMVGNTGGTSAEVNRGGALQKTNPEFVRNVNAPRVTGQRAQPTGKPGLIGGTQRVSEIQRERGGAGRARNEVANAKRELTRRSERQNEGSVRQRAVANAARRSPRNERIAEQQKDNSERYGGRFGPFPAPGGSGSLVQR